MCMWGKTNTLNILCLSLMTCVVWVCPWQVLFSCTNKIRSSVSFDHYAVSLRQCFDQNGNHMPDVPFLPIVSHNSSFGFLIDRLNDRGDSEETLSHFTSYKFQRIASDLSTCVLYACGVCVGIHQAWWETWNRINRTNGYGPESNFHFTQ